VGEKKPASLWLCELVVTENVRRREQLAEVVAREDPGELRRVSASGPVSAQWVRSVATRCEELTVFALLHCSDAETIIEVSRDSSFPKVQALLSEFDGDRGARVALRAEGFWWLEQDPLSVLVGLEKNALERRDLYGDSAWRRGVAALDAKQARVYLYDLPSKDHRWNEKVATAVLLQYYQVESGSLVFEHHPLITLGAWCPLDGEGLINVLAGVIDRAIECERGHLDVRLFMELEAAVGSGDKLDVEVLALEMAFDNKGDLGYRWCSDDVFEWLLKSSLIGLLARHPLSSGEFRRWLGILGASERYLAWRQFCRGGMRSREDLSYFLDLMDEAAQGIGERGDGSFADSSFADNMSNGVLDLCYSPDDPLFLRIRDSAEETSVLNYLCGKWCVGGVRLWPARDDLLTVYNAQVSAAEARRWGRSLGEVAASQGPEYWRQCVLEEIPWALAAALERSEVYCAIYAQLREAGVRADLAIEHLGRARSEAVTLGDLRERLVAFTKALADSGGAGAGAHSEYLDVSSTPKETRNYEYVAIGTAKRVGPQ
jgi:hypothetical protein